MAEILIKIPVSQEINKTRICAGKDVTWQTNRTGLFFIYQNWNCSVQKYINICCICGYKGYSAVIKQDVFCTILENKAVYSQLPKILCKLELDESGRHDRQMAGILFAAETNILNIHGDTDACQNDFNNRLCCNYAIQFSEVIQNNYTGNKQYGISQNGNRE